MKLNKLSATLISFLLCGGAALADTIVLKDGSTHEGKVVSMTSTTVAFRENGVTHHYSRTNIDSLQTNGSSGASANQNGYQSGEPELGHRSTTPTRYGRSVTLPAGTEIAVMTNQPIDSSSVRAGQTYQADIANNVVDESGRVAIPKGSPAELVLKDVSSGGMTGSREMTVDLESVKVGDKRYMIDANDVKRSGGRDGIGANRRTAEMTGGGAAIGTLIGAIAGGGKGAAIGALGGAAAGAGTQILTRGKSVKIPSETTLRFKLDQPLHLSAAY